MYLSSGDPDGLLLSRALLSWQSAIYLKVVNTASLFLTN